MQMHQLGAAAATASTSWRVRPSLIPFPSPHQSHILIRCQRGITFPATRTEKPAQVAAAATPASLQNQQRLEAVSHDLIAIPESVVTGGNRGIGLEVCRQLALQGVTVILTARDEKRGKDAASLRHESNLANIIFHQLDILDKNSRASLARHIESRYGKLDILVNNAGVGGVVVDQDGLRALNIDPKIWVVNLYTRILAKRHPEMRISCVHPSFVKTEINWNTGIIPPEEGARGAVKLALLPEDGPTGRYFDQTEVGDAW